MKWLWLQDLVRKPKDDAYAKIVLDRYRLGIKAHGEIRGARIIPGSVECETAMSVSGKTYLPDDAPIIPIQACTLSGGCRCSYTPVMNYEPQSSDASQSEPAQTV
jgi:hypothetical protein